MIYYAQVVRYNDAYAHLKAVHEKEDIRVMLNYCYAWLDNYDRESGDEAKLDRDELVDVYNTANQGILDRRANLV